MSNPSCPSAARLLEILRNSNDFKPDQPVSTIEEFKLLLEQNGVDVDNCDRTQLLTVIRDFFAGLSDSDLVLASGGEVLKAVAVAATAGAAVTAVAVGVGAGVGGDYGTKYVQGS